MTYVQMQSSMVASHHIWIVFVKNDTEEKNYV